jgi:hypothetical protein
MIMEEGACFISELSEIVFLKEPTAGAGKRVQRLDVFFESIFIDRETPKTPVHPKTPSRPDPFDRGPRPGAICAATM